MSSPAVVTARGRRTSMKARTLGRWSDSLSSLRAEAADLPLASTFAMRDRRRWGGRPPNGAFRPPSYVRPAPPRRSGSVRPCQRISMRRGRSRSGLGRRSESTPPSRDASTCSSSTSPGRVTSHANRPTVRSRRRRMPIRSFSLRSPAIETRRAPRAPSFRSRCVVAQAVPLGSSPPERQEPGRRSRQGSDHSAQAAAEPASMADCLPAPAVISTFRGLACSATGIVTVKTPLS
jgi:hypothetical protein